VPLAPPPATYLNESLWPRAYLQRVAYCLQQWAE
jgi:hypothetical protein